jgi:2-dehydropantoate 2-reductase
MRIAVVGVGGVGAYFGGRLAQAGEDVVFVARSRQLAALRARGLTVESIEGDFRLDRVEVTDDPTQVGPVDVILLGVKAWQVAEAAPALRPLLGPRSCVLPLQNGVEAPLTLTAALGREHVLGGLCSLIAYVVEPGRVRHAGGAPFIKFGELDNARSERVERLRAVFARAAGLTVEVPPDIEAAMWEKFIFIAGWGGVGALTRAPIGVLRAQAGTRRILQDALREIFNIGIARGIALAAETPETVMNALDELPADGTASMQRDIVQGRPSELEAQTGAVVRLGREAGVVTPINALIYESLRPQELRARRELRF